MQYLVTKNQQDRYLQGKTKMPKYIDIHSHVNFIAFDADRDEVIRRAGINHSCQKHDPILQQQVGKCHLPLTSVVSALNHRIGQRPHAEKWFVHWYAFLKSDKF